MKFFSILFLFTSISKLGAQHDTIRLYYINDSLHSEYPRLNGLTEGLCKRYYPNGKIKSEEIYHNQQAIGTHRQFYKNGHVRVESTYKKNALQRIYFYDSSGTLIESRSISNHGQTTRFWHANGQLASEESYANGSPIGCVSMNAIVTCYCKNQPVFWKDSAYVNLEGKIVNSQYRYTLKKYDELGRIKSSMKQKGLYRYHKEWDKNSHLIASYRASIEEVPVKTGDGSSSEIKAYEEMPLKPLHKSQFKDTVIQSIQITKRNDSMITYQIDIHYYDSTGFNIANSAKVGHAMRYFADTGWASQLLKPYAGYNFIYTSGTASSFLAFVFDNMDSSAVLLIAETNPLGFVLGKMQKIK